MLKAKQLSVRLHFASTSRDRPSHKISAKLFAWRFLSVTFLPLTHTIYTFIIHKSKKKGYSKRKPQIGFYNTTHPAFRQRATHPHQVLLLSFSNYHTLRGDLYPNTTHTFSECRECFRTWEAYVICQKKKKLVRISECNRAVLWGSRKLVKTRLRGVCWQQEFGGLKYIR